MRPYATVLLVACCLASLAGCSGRGHRHWCLFGDRFRHKHCVDRDEWDQCDDDWDDDDDGGCSCGCHGGHVAPQCGAPMPAFDTGCGCDSGMSMPTYYGGMPMSYDSFAPSSGCASCGGAMGAPMMYPTFDQPVMMNSPLPTPTPAPAATPTPAVAPAAEYYSPGAGSTPTATSNTVPPKY